MMQVIPVCEERVPHSGGGDLHRLHTQTQETVHISRCHNSTYADQNEIIAVPLSFLKSPAYELEGTGLNGSSADPALRTAGQGRFAIGGHHGHLDGVDAGDSIRMRCVRS